MRLTKKEIHPALFTAAEKLYDGHTGTPTGDEAANKHFEAWMVEYWKGLVGYIALLPAGLYLAASINTGDKVSPVSFAAYAALFLSWIGIGVWLYKVNSELITPKEIEALRNAPKMSENARLYADCVLTVLNSKLIGDTQKSDWLKSLWQTMDDSVRLESMVQKGSSEPVQDLNSITAERIAIEAKLEKSEDLQAREAYQSSLDLLKHREQNAISAHPYLERAEAHLELIKQTFLETNRRLATPPSQASPQPSDDLNLQTLRENLERVQTDSNQILRAVAELDA